MKPLTHVESQRTELLQFVLLLVMVFLGFIAYLSFKQEQGLLIPALTIVALLGCLYAIGRERRLRKLQGQLVAQFLKEHEKSSSLEARLKDVTALYRAISRVSAVADPGETFGAVLEAALELVEGDLGSIMMLDDSGEHLVIVSAQGLQEEVVAGTRQRVGSGVAGWVAVNREVAVLAGKASEDGRFGDAVEHERAVGLSASVPLELRDNLVGVMNLGVSPGKRDEPFSEHDLRLVAIFTQHAAVAIENTRLRTLGSAGAP